MRTKPIIPSFGPCVDCEYREGCVAYEDLRKSLYSLQTYQLEPTLDRMDMALDELTEAWFATLSRLNEEGHRSSEGLGRAISCLFDFAATGLYASSIISPTGQVSQKGIACNGYLAFPYTWMCPLCVADGLPDDYCYLPGARREIKGSIKDYPVVELLAKPGGRRIGDAGVKIIKAILRYLIRRAPEQIRVREGGGRRGEFDLTLTTNDYLAFVEVKAKPLIAYPLVLHLDAPGDREHKWINITSAGAHQLSFFLGARNKHLPIDSEFGDVWPLPSLTRMAEDVETVRLLLANWIEHLEAYTIWTKEPKRLRWHRFGCGNFGSMEGGLPVEKRVANTKELPGLDRTDDIKKGTAQLLLFSRFKFDCKADALRTVLMANLYAEVHGSDYIDPLATLRVARSIRPLGPSLQEEALEGEALTEGEGLLIEEDGEGVSTAAWRWLFDAIIGFSQNRINSPDLQAMFDFSRPR